MLGKVFTGFVVAGMLVCGGAEAGPYTDDLSKCLVASATQDDQTDLMRWIFSAIALHPAIKVLSNITPEQRIEIDKRAGALFERLLIVDCHAQSVAALKYEGRESFEGSFNTLGQIAARGLFTAPEVNAGMAGLTANIDMNKVGALFNEAGISDK